ncbi:ABC transporter substrate-binding protein [Knoellia aerolata]|uniref:ABC transporter substrate-binding protein n=1 Tax=Knoellia aerolata DSM 18566 TaxID=1385519 RepID=A0A0A0K5K3_9MICO|nr:ABC transporter substrate-binding protein [Knoellia aerolata]KGN43111.1 ABC transporter substrate-binding protein [Knoellia aerolata DSM 18566]
MTTSSHQPPRPARSGRVRAAAAAATVALLAAVAGCSLLGGGDDDVTTPRVAAADERTDEPGGTLRALSLGPVLTWDPQRIAARDDAAFAGRTFLRTLTAYQPSTDTRNQSRLVGDLATDTGTPNEDLTAWSFTLREDIAWQDGSPVTCEDVKYGISRTFATDVISGGSTDALAVLAVEKLPDGRSLYRGPYAAVTAASAAAGVDSFDRAVSCRGTTITFTLASPVGDFNEMVTQPAFAPVKKSADKRGDGTFAVFSNGPYQLSAPWRPSTGGSWVRNPHWKSTSDEVRQGYPDRIEYVEGIETQTVAQQIMADGDNARAAVSLGSAPPAIQQHIVTVDSLSDRAVTAGTGLVDYLVPNVRSAVFASVEARQALAVATNRAAYVTALGGAGTGRPAPSLIPEVLPAHHDENPLASGDRGDPDAAKALLGKAGLTIPVPIRVAYRSSPVADKAMAALVAGWTDAGFAPTLSPLEDEYFSTIAQPAAATAYDVFWSNWAPAWASASTILPALFDSTVNLSGGGPGRDYGYFADPGVDTEIARIGTIADRGEREKAWAALDVRLQTLGAYVGLAERRSLYIAGSDVRNLSANEVIGGVVEFADIAVRR